MNENGEIVERNAVENKAELDAVLSDISPEHDEQAPELRPTKEKQLDATAESVMPALPREGETHETSDAVSITEKRRKTDLTVYKFYFRFVNWRRAIIFAVFQICLAFLSSFPGKSRHQSSMVYSPHDVLF